MNINNVVRCATLVAGLYGSACAHATDSQSKPGDTDLEATNQQAVKSALEYLITENSTRLVEPGVSKRFRTIEEAVSHLRNPQ